MNLFGCLCAHEQPKLQKWWKNCKCVFGQYFQTLLQTYASSKTVTLLQPESTGVTIRFIAETHAGPTEKRVKQRLMGKGGSSILISTKLGSSWKIWLYCTRVLHINVDLMMFNLSELVPLCPRVCLHTLITSPKAHWMDFFVVVVTVPLRKDEDQF